MEWAISQGARVINMSFAGPYDPSLERALKDAAAKGVILIGASGNAGPKSPPLWPGADPNVIAVTATDSGDKGFRRRTAGLSSLSRRRASRSSRRRPRPATSFDRHLDRDRACQRVVALMLERDPTLTPLRCG